jgi:hypothetical protein
MSGTKTEQSPKSTEASFFTPVFKYLRPSSITSSVRASTDGGMMNFFPGELPLVFSLLATNSSH